MIRPSYPRSGKLRALTGATVLAAGITAVIPAVSQAAVVSVACSENALVGAIDTANATPGSDTLNLAAGCTYVGNFTLTSVTLNNGSTLGSGGGVLNSGAVTFTSSGSGLTNNTAVGTGGGLSNTDTADSGGQRNSSALISSIGLLKARRLRGRSLSSVATQSRSMAL